MARAVDLLRQVAPEAGPGYLAAFDRGDSLLRQHQITNPDRHVHYLAQRTPDTRLTRVSEGRDETNEF
jgi:hypothetical protein